MIEDLENRRLLSAALGDDVDVLITGTPGDDNIAVWVGGSTIVVSEGGYLSFFDSIQSRIFNITIKSRGGNDHITIEGDMPATVFAGRGNDWISSGAGNDVLYGGRDNDTILGNDGGDFLIGRAGHDILKGGVGDDILDGFDGHRDRLLGGPGKDFARVDRRVDFGRNLENILRIDPDVASSHQNNAGYVVPVAVPDTANQGSLVLAASYDAIFGAGGFNALFKFANVSGRVVNFNTDPTTDQQPVDETP